MEQLICPRGVMQKMGLLMTEDRQCLLSDLLTALSLRAPHLPSITWSDTQGSSACLDMVAASACWQHATVEVDEAIQHVRASDHVPLWLTLQQPKLSRKRSRRHIRTWPQAAQEQQHPIAKGWQCLDLQAFNSIVSQQMQDHMQAQQPTISAIARVMNQAASYTKSYPAPHEDGQVASLYNQANLAEGLQRKRLLSDAAALRRIKRTRARYRQAQTLSSGIWWQTRRIQQPRHVPTTMATQPGHPQHERTSWPQMVSRYCQRLFRGPPKEQVMIQAFVTLARQRAAARKRALEWCSDEPTSTRLSFCYHALDEAVKSMPLNKAVGTDGISTEILLALNHENRVLLARILERHLNVDDDSRFQAVLSGAGTDTESAHESDPWQTALALLLPKKPMPESLLDYRSIHLLPVLQKLYMRDLVARISPHVWAAITTNQFGARPGHQALQIIQSIRLLQEKCWEGSQQLILIKIDIRKAFDRTRRSLIMKRLLSLDTIDARLTYALVKEWALPLVQPCLSGQLSQDKIAMSVGLRQGGSDSSLAFVLAMDSALLPAVSKWRHLTYGIPVVGLAAVNHYLFVDDLVLVAASIPQALEMHKDAIACLDKAGLQVQGPKTEHWSSSDVPLHPRRNPPGIDCSAQGITIFGSKCHFPHGEAIAVSHRIKAMWATYQRLRGILRCPAVSLHKRLQILSRPVMLSCCCCCYCRPVRAADP